MARWVDRLGCQPRDRPQPRLLHASQFLAVKECEAAGDAGAAIGATLVFILWFLGFVVLGLVCPSCGYDFLTRQAGVPTRNIGV